MSIDISKLITVANYARKIKKSVTWVYRLGERKEIDIIEIDGKKFVKHEN